MKFIGGCDAVLLCSLCIHCYVAIYLHPNPSQNCIYFILTVLYMNTRYFTFVYCFQRLNFGTNLKVSNISKASDFMVYKEKLRSSRYKHSQSATIITGNALNTFFSVLCQINSFDFRSLIYHSHNRNSFCPFRSHIQYTYMKSQQLQHIINGRLFTAHGRISQDICICRLHSSPKNTKGVCF